MPAATLGMHEHGAVSATPSRCGSGTGSQAEEAKFAESAGRALGSLEAALIRLGPVTIVGFADTGFMIVDGRGERMYGASLPEAIDAALSVANCDRPKLGYRREAGGHDRAA